MNIPRHSIRFGKSSEKKILEIHQSTFESIVLNASTLVHFGKSLSTFIFIKSKGKSFFIDPLSHAFQHPLDKISNERGEIKISVKKIINLYGKPLTDVILNQERPLRPEDFSENELKRNFVKRVLDFQEKHLFSSLEDDFKEYLEEDEFRSMIPSVPLFLVPPYFYLTESNYRKWVGLNRTFVEMSKDAVENSNRIFGELVVNKALLKTVVENNNAFEEIIGIYKEADGILFWIDDFDEHKTDKEFLKIVINFVKKTKEKFPGKPLVNLYGGYFSQILLKIGLDGVVHGPEYGESRAVVPVGGGIPIAKYYYPGIRKRVPSNETIWMLKSQKIFKPETFFERVCCCKVCRSNIIINAIEDFIEKYGNTQQVSYGTSLREFPIQETVENCLGHYLEVKKIEFDDILNKDLQMLLNELEKTYKTFEGKIWIDINDINHLKQWVNAFKYG